MCSVQSRFSFMIKPRSLAELVGLMGSVPSENVVLVILGLFHLLTLYSMNAYFFALKYKKFAPLQICKLFISSFNLLMSWVKARSSTLQISLRSSAKRSASEKNTLSGRSLMYKMKSNGPSIEPCGTPEVMMPLEEMGTLIFTD